MREDPTVTNLLNRIDQLKIEVDGWKEATKRNSIQGFILGGAIFFWIGYIAAYLILKP